MKDMEGLCLRIYEGEEEIVCVCTFVFSSHSLSLFIPLYAVHRLDVGIS